MMVGQSREKSKHTLAEDKIEAHVDEVCRHERVLARGLGHVCIIEKPKAYEDQSAQADRTVHNVSLALPRRQDRL